MYTNVDSSPECRVVTERPVSIQEAFNDPQSSIHILEELGFVQLSNHLR
jgi:hypothetical protein